MTGRRQLTLVAAAATLLSTAPLATVFASWAWALDCLGAVAAVCVVALASRALRAPVWGQTLAMLAVLTIVLTWMFGSGALAGTVPTPTTLRHFGDLLHSAGRDIRMLGVPVPDRTGLLMLTTLSIGLVAIAVDLMAVSMRRPALAGFPMLAIYWIPVLVRPDALSPVPFVVGAIGFLWLLAADSVDRVRYFGRRFTGDGRDVPAAAPSPLAAAGRRLAVVGVVVAVALPLAVPGMTSGLLDRWGGGGSGGGGGGGANGATVNLFSALQGQLNRDQVFDMLTVTTDDPSPYYLRFGVADQLTGDGFAAYSPSGGASVTAGLPAPTPPRPGVQATTYHATVRILDFSMGLLPIYGRPTAVRQLDSSWYYDPAGNVIYSNLSNSSGKKYSFDFVHTDYSPQALRTALPLPPGDPLQRSQTRVPEVPMVQDLVATLTEGKATPYDKVRALYDYFSVENGFGYALSTKSGTSDTDIEDFLTNKQGYCEQYAAALAWLVRAAGIPARVAFGFTRGSATDGRTYTLTNFNLHAWTEVYFSGFGWVPFDATPTAYIAGSVSPSWAPDVNHKDAVTPGLGTQGGPDPDASTAPDATTGRDPGAADQNAGNAGAAGPGHAAVTWPWWLLGAVLLVLLILLLPALRRAALRRARRPASRGADGADVTAGEMVVVPATDGSGLRAAAHAAWDEFLDTLVDYRVEVDQAETPRATVRRVGRMLSRSGAAVAGLALLGQAEERARYARQPRPVGGLAGALRDVHAALADGATRWARVRATLLPPSVLRRWRATVVEAVTGAVVAAGRRRDTIVRAVDLRKLLPGRPAAR